jgi:hypothetical protein
VRRQARLDAADARQLDRVADDGAGGEMIHVRGAVVVTEPAGVVRREDELRLLGPDQAHQRFASFDVVREPGIREIEQRGDRTPGRGLQPRLGAPCRDGPMGAAFALASTRRSAPTHPDAARSAMVPHRHLGVIGVSAEHENVVPHAIAPRSSYG